TPDGAFLGVSSADLDAVSGAVLRRYGVEADEGAFITEVVPGSAAARGGIEVGDVITEIDGREVDSAGDVRRIVLDHDAGDEVEITLERRGEERTVTVTLGKRS